MKTTKTTLKEIAEIQTGYVFRGRVQEDPEGNVQVIQNKDLVNGRVVLAGLTTVSTSSRGRQQYVHRGDILLRTRGVDLAVALVEEEPARETILAAPLMLIRTKDTAVDPAYVAWQLRQPAAQEYLRGSARGSTLPTISKVAVEHTPLELPEPVHQQLVAEIAGLSAEVRRMAHELAEKEAAYVNAVLNK